MIELEALKEQLRLLGHSLPDDQIANILRDMNIDFSDGKPAGTSGIVAGTQSIAPQQTRRSSQATGSGNELVDDDDTAQVQTVLTSLRCL